LNTSDFRNCGNPRSLNYIKRRTRGRGSKTPAINKCNSQRVLMCSKMLLKYFQEKMPTAWTSYIIYVFGQVDKG